MFTRAQNWLNDVYRSVLLRMRRQSWRDAHPVIQHFRDGSHGSHIKFASKVETMEPRLLMAAQLGGTVFNDLDADGVQDGSEVGAAGIDVYLDANGNDQFDQGELLQETASDGTYQFTGLAAGTYDVRLALNPAWETSAPAGGEFNVTLVTDEVRSDVNLGASARLGLSPKIQTGTVNVTESWTTINLDEIYDRMVVVATPIYTQTSDPLIVRMRNVTDSSFELSVTQAMAGTPNGPAAIDVHFIAVEEGKYTQSEHGIDMEAYRFVSDETASKVNWNRVHERSLANNYNAPIVFGQVMTANDPEASTFVAYGSSRQTPVSSSSFFVGKSVSEDPAPSRVDEELGYIVFEAGSGRVGSLNYEVGITADNVQGLNTGGRVVTRSSGFDADGVLLGTNGIDGADGGWGVLVSDISGSDFTVGIDEDQWTDTERSHTTEQLSYLVFGQADDVSEMELDAHLPLNEISGTVAADIATSGQDNSGTLVGGAQFVNDSFRGYVASFDGTNSAVEIPDSDDINRGTHRQRTIGFWFRANDPASTGTTQVLYEEGGTVRGLAIYLRNGKLYGGGWNTNSESGWPGTYLDVDAPADGGWHHVLIRLSGDESIRDNSISFYLDGALVGRGEGSQLWQHTGDIGIGGNNDNTRLHYGNESGDAGFDGLISDFRLYNRALDAREIMLLGASYNPPSTMMLLSNSVLENQAGLTVGEILVADPDQVDEHTIVVNDARFEIVTNPEGRFFLKLVDGVSLVAADFPNGLTLDFVVTDRTGLTLPVTLTLDVVPDVPANPNDTVLVESAGLVTEAASSVFTLDQLGRDPETNEIIGAHKLTFDLSTYFDLSDSSQGLAGLSEDSFQVYINDSVTGNALIENGVAGTAAFSLMPDASRFAAGVVTFDGTTVTIDLTGLYDHVSSPAGVQLLFQLLTPDQDTLTQVVVSEVLQSVDIEGAAAATGIDTTYVIEPDAAVTDFSGYAEVTDATLSLDRIRFNSATGTYEADMKLLVTGSEIGKNTIAVFDGLPAGVTLANASGTLPSGHATYPDAAYINLARAIGSGGMVTGEESLTVRIQLDVVDPALANSRFDLSAALLSEGPNQAPVIGNGQTVLNLTTGDYVTYDIQGSDPDNDQLSYRLIKKDGLEAPLPGIVLNADGTLEINPLPGSEGTYNLAVAVFDGAIETVQDLTVTVTADAITTTRLSGRIMDDDGVTGLQGFGVSLIQPVSANNPTLITYGTATTDSNGYFTIDVTQPLPADQTANMLSVAIDALQPYPSLAEPARLLFAQDIIEGINNTIGRPIYLPIVNDGQAIDPTVGGQVIQQLDPARPTEAMAEVDLSANSIRLPDGTIFDGKVNVTEVPREFTPASLPQGFYPDIVVTIQGEETATGEGVMLQFDDQAGGGLAQLTLPNRAGYLPGYQLELWSVDPATGDFEMVGMGEVSADGTMIETISGGIRNSSWHAFVPPTPPMVSASTSDLTMDASCGCGGIGDNGIGIDAREVGSEVLLHSGSLHEYHYLSDYTSLGQSRGVGLHYFSEWADVKPIISFSYVAPPDNGGALIANLAMTRGNTRVMGAGADAVFEEGGAHKWEHTPGETVTASIQIDMGNYESGLYTYDINSGFLVENDAGEYSGRTSSVGDQFVVVNQRESEFGAGWGISGLQRLIENPNGDLLFLDGGGHTFAYGASGGGTYVSPPGEFSTVVKNGDGTYTRTLTNGTVYQFDTQGRVLSETTRVGHVTTWRYAAGGISEIEDPAGLKTQFFYDDEDRVQRIVDPAGRETLLAYDAQGNLTSITDPDGAERSFTYDQKHRMLSETDARGNSEQFNYGFHGRLNKVVRNDGTVLEVDAAQTRYLQPPEETTGALINNPGAGGGGGQVLANPLPPSGPPTTFFIDANGNTEEIELDKLGQRVMNEDGEGAISSLVRNSDNLVSEYYDGRDNLIEYDYNGDGYVIESRELVTNFNGSTDHQGKEFWLAFGENVAGPGLRLGVTLISDVATDATVSIPGLSFTQNVSLQAGVAQYVALPANAFVSRGLYDRGVHITALDEIAVYGHNHRDLASGDSFVALPLEQLGFEYFVAAHDQYDGSVISYGPEFYVVATEGNTLVTFDEQPAITLQQGQVYHVESQVNGLHVVADKPVAVFGGHQQATVGGLGYGSYLVEQMPPITSLGTRFLVDTLERFDSNPVTILASEDATEVHINGSLVATLDAGETHDVTISGAREIVTSKPSLVVEYASGEEDDGDQDSRKFPLKIVIPAVEQWSNEYRFGPAVGDAITVYENHLTLSVHENGLGTIYQDGVLINQNLFNRVGNSDYFMATVTLPDDVSYEFTSVRNFGAVFHAYKVGASFDLSYGMPLGYAFPAVTQETLTRQYTYDATFNQLTSIIDERGNLTLFEVDALNGNRLNMREVIGANDLTSGETDDLVTIYTYTAENLIDTVTDAEGRITDYDYDLYGRLTDVTYALGSSVEASMSYEYADLTGNITAMIDENGHRTEYTYDAMNRLLSLTEPDPDLTNGTVSDQPVTAFTYDLNGNLESVTDAAGRVDRYQYDALDRQISMTEDADIDGDGGGFNYVTRRDYDSQGNLAHTTDALGRGTEFKYDTRNRLESVTDAEGNLTTYVYDTDNNVVQIIDPRGNSTRLTYDERDRLVVVTDAHGEQSIFTYDGTNNLVMSEDRNGNVTNHVYDNVNRLAETIDALGQSMFYGYDKVSNLTSLTDRNGNVTSFAYDERDRETSVTDAELNVTSYGYDVESRLTSLTDPNGNLTEYVYDDLDRLLEVKEQNPAGPAGDTTGGPVSTFAYDVMSNLVSETDANGNATDYQYDSVYRLSRVTGQNPASPGSGSTSGGPETDYFYDAVHNLTLVQDANNNNTIYTYDNIDRRVSVEDALNNITTFTYDGNSNLLSVNDADSNSTTYVYDALNRLTSETDEQGQVMSYAYDAHGNVAEMTDRNDRVTTYDYDGLHRLTQEDWYETVAKTNRQNRIVYGYDAEGNLTSIADDFSTYTFAYDDIYRLTQEAGTNSTITTGTVDVTLGYTYDNASNRLTMAETIGGVSAVTTNYQYDMLNRLVGMDQNGDSTAGDKSIEFDYDALGLLEQVRRYNDTAKTNQVSRSDFAYDGLNRITDMDHRDQSDSIIAFYDYAYDGVGNLTGQTDTDGSIAFGVNARNEVTSADYDPADVRSDESYNYDATSDLSTRNGTSFTEGDGNEVTGDGTYTYAYDDEGNLILQTLIAGGSYREFTYDHRNRLTSVTDKTSGGVITASVTYTYDALNRRILKDDGTTQTAYSYDGSDVQLEFVNGVLAVRYFQGLGIDDVFAEENVGLVGDAQIDWLLSDRQGTIKDVLDGSGDLAQHVIFDTYGNIIQIADGTGAVQTVNDLLTEYGFTSRRYEQETGLWYFRARYYNSELGRFISRDPAGFVDGPSLYAGYFASQWGTDPTGLAYVHMKRGMGGGPLGITRTGGGGGGVRGGGARSAPRSVPRSAPRSTPRSAPTGRSRPSSNTANGNYRANKPGRPVKPLTKPINKPINQPGKNLGGKKAPAKPTEPYNRRKHYGNTPTKADRKAVGAGKNQVADHNPPLVKRYYEGDPCRGEKPGFQMTPAQRTASAKDRSRMKPQPRADSNKQGGQMSKYSKDKKKEHGL